jgi:hypothetical protein
VLVNGKPVALLDGETHADGTISSAASTIHIEEGRPSVFIGNNVHIGKNVAFHASKPAWKSIETIVPSAKIALKEAMLKEGVPAKEYDNLAWIMAQESGGHVNSKNPTSSARGLFQLTRVNYHLNPNGEDSFGNAIEECQGSIRYIMNRYGNPEKAVTFWQEHKWY